MVAERGDVWWVDLGDARGSAPALRRPVVVVSADAYNQSKIQTVICAAITSNLRLADAPGNVPLPEGAAGLDRESVVNVSQVVTLDKLDLTERLGTLGRGEMRRIESGLRQVLNL